MIPECTAFAVAPHASENGHTVVGQNWDWLVHCFDTVIVLEVEQPDAPNFVTVVEAGLLAKAGLNAAGIAVATNALVTEHDRGEPGLPYHVLLRAIYDSQTVADALTALQRGIRSSSANYLIGRAGGAVVDVEAAPGDFTMLQVRGPSNGVLVHTNHFLSPPAGTTDFSLWAMPDSAVRLGRFQAAMEVAGPTWPVATVQAALADHADFPSGVCCHPDPREHPLEQGATVASLVIDTDDRRLWLADGNPCTVPYRALDYREFLAPGPLGSPAPRSDLDLSHASP